MEVFSYPDDERQSLWLSVGYTEDVHSPREIFNDSEAPVGTFCSDLEDRKCVLFMFLQNEEEKEDMILSIRVTIMSCGLG